jgi:hypothetical protein
VKETKPKLQMPLRLFYFGYEETPPTSEKGNEYDFLISFYDDSTPPTSTVPKYVKTPFVASRMVAHTHRTW